MTADVADVAIVGAGLSGLVCARRLAAAGARVVVLEARDRVGGRTRSVRFGSAVVDLGGAWLSANQPRLGALADELGVATFPQFRDGAPIVAADPAPRRLAGRLLGALALRRCRRAIDRMIRAADPAADARSLGDWLDREVGDADVRAQIALHAELTFAAAPGDLSLLFYLASLGATGGFGEPGSRERRFLGGAQALSSRLAAGLDVRLGEPVAAISDDGAAVRVVTAGGERAARRAVLAIPPALAAAIAFTPPLPAAMRRLADGSRPGPVVKCVVGYPRAFWRDAGLSGEAYQLRGTVRAVVDLCEPDGASPALLAFVVAGEAARWGERDLAERRGAVIDELVGLFGDGAAEPVGLVEMDWARDRWSAGCVAGLGPGRFAGARWREPHGRIHVAGTESAVAWPGYMEGAIEAGERAAAEILSLDGAA